MVTEKNHNSDANITTQTTGVKINNKYRHDREGALSLEVPTEMYYQHDGVPRKSQKLRLTCHKKSDLGRSCGITEI